MRFWAAALVLLGSACAPLTPRPGTPLDDPRWAVHRESLAGVLGFALEGRIAQTGGQSGNLHWRQHADGHFELQLSGPFGVGAVAIEGDPGGVVVRTRDGASPSPAPELWMQTHLGWHLPLASLRAWALGVPAAGPVEALELDGQGRLSVLRQHGWTVRYADYQHVGALELPRRLEAQSEATRLRLVIDRWTAVDFAAHS